MLKKLKIKKKKPVVYLSGFKYMRNIEKLRNVASKHFVSFLPISVHVYQMYSLPVMKQFLLSVINIRELLKVIGDTFLKAVSSI